MTRKRITMPSGEALVPGQAIVINVKDRLYLDSQRPAAMNIIEGRAVRYVSLDDLHRIYTKYFAVPFSLQTQDLEKLKAWLKDLYAKYDEWLSTADLAKIDARKPLKEISKLILDTQRPQAEVFIKCQSAKQLDIYGLQVVMQDEFNPDYHLNLSDPEEPTKMLKELYRLYDERKEEELTIKG